MIGDIYNTTVNVNGSTMYSRTFYPGSCCCNGYMNSCFGFGYGGFGAGLGVGVGFAAGMAMVPLMPTVIKGVWSGIKWFGSSVIAPAAKGAWNGIKWAGNMIAKGACAVAKGVKNLWNNIFHKKSKSKTQKA